MNSARVILCLAIMCVIGSPAIVRAQAGDADGPFVRAEEELEKAAHTDPSHPSGTADPLSVDPDLAIWTVVVFVILLVILKRFAWGPIVEALERREQNIAEHIAQAERNHEQARLLLAEYEKKLATAANEVRQLLEEARRDAEHTKHEILVEARKGAEAEKARALRDIEAAADAATESLAQRSAELAVDLAGRILQAQLSRDDHARLIQEAMAKFPAATPSSN